MSDKPTFLNRIPQLASRWWTVVLAISLMANLLIVGLGLGHRFGPHRGEMMPRQEMMQLIPKKFISELPNERRREIMDFLRGNKNELKSLRDAAQENALKLAAALENYNTENVKSVIETFTTGTSSLAAQRGVILNELITKLTPDERKSLATAIKERRGADNH
jgi:uncharacterized membrane protein